MDKMINIKINNKPVSVKEGTTILNAARQLGLKIPTLCYLKEINEIGACRICVVELKGRPNLVASCVFPVAEGMEIYTNSPKVIKARKTTLELLLSDHDKSCLSCIRSTNCELQQLSYEYGCEANFVGVQNNHKKDESTTWLIRDNNKCINCRRCVAVCDKVQDVGVVGANGRGFETRISCAFERNLMDTPCVACGQCVAVCPTGALSERDDTQRVFDAINDPDKIVIVGTAPAVRVGLGEEFGTGLGSDTEGKMVAALRRLGFDNVFDVNITADLTILEEGTEFIGRVANALAGKPAVLPMMTSCSPGWIKYIETYHHTLLDNLSTCQSPQQMFGSVVKSYYAEKLKVDPSKIMVVSIMPCTAKKFEVKRPEFNSNVDVSLTTRELARMIKRQGLDYNNLPDEKFDDPLGISTGAAVIFGATGGVMEAALRTVYAVLMGTELPNPNLEFTRGTKGIKVATVPGLKVKDANGKEHTIDAKVAIASGIRNARIIMEEVKAGNPNGYHFIEIMTCPGGCANGGGQPIRPVEDRNFDDIAGKRGAAIYRNDANNPGKLRVSHKSPVVDELYKSYFIKPNSEKAHHILHTSYVAREKYPKPGSPIATPKKGHH